jgi:hypothetical protein
VAVIWHVAQLLAALPEPASALHVLAQAQTPANLAAELGAEAAWWQASQLDGAHHVISHAGGLQPQDY